MQKRITKYADTAQKTVEEDIFSVPQDWNVVPLKDVVKPKNGIKRGPWGGSIKKEIFVSSGFKVYEQKNVIENDFEIGHYFVDDNKFQELRDFEIHEGDILLTAAGTIGKVAIAPSNLKRGIINQALIRIRLNEDLIDPVFFKLFFEFDRERLREFSHGAVLVNISSVKALQNFPVLLPPFLEQQKIGKVLSTIRTALKRQDKIIEAAKTLKKSLIHKLFTEGLGHTELKETEIGEVPASWEIAKLQDLGDFQYGYTASAAEDPIGPKFLRITDIKDERELSWEEVPYCHIPESKFGKYKLKDGDILIARIGATTGKTCIIQRAPEAIFASYLIRIKVQGYNKAYPSFVYYFTNTSTYWAQIDANKGGKLKKGVSASFLKTLKIPLPPIDEQKEIARMLSTVDEKIRLEEKRKTILSELFKTMLSKLMTGEIRLKDVEVE